MCPIFSFVIDLTVINKENHFMLPPDLKVKLKFTFLIDVVRRRRGFNCSNKDRFETTPTTLRSWFIGCLLFFSQHFLK